MENDQSGTAETRQDRREKKLRKKRERVPKHGRSLAEMYRRVIFKRLKGGGKK